LAIIVGGVLKKLILSIFLGGLGLTQSD